MAKLEELFVCGQSYWLDNLTREMIVTGELKRRVESEGLRGMTSNPKTFSNAISRGAAYDDQIRELASDGLSAESIYERLAVADVQNACDVLRPVYDASHGGDGYVSLEVSPYLAHDAKRTMEEARRLNRAVARPNVMIKIPGTRAGLDAIEEMLYEGVNVNVTLLFALDRYEAVADRYLRALERRVRDGDSIEGTRSVASFFLSRIDVLADRLLSQRVTPGAERRRSPEALFGKVAIASAKLAYRSFQKTVSTDRFRSLTERGARVQRLLWASTSTKNPSYSDVKYVEPLIGRDTVNTMPARTIDAFADHGTVTPDAIEKDVDAAVAVFAAASEVGLDLSNVTWQLEHEGIKKFVMPYDDLIATLDEKRRALEPGPRSTFDLIAFERLIRSHSDAWQEAKLGRRLHVKDPFLWTDEPGVAHDIANRLGWIDSAEHMAERIPGILKFAREISDGFDHVLLLGMGGSSETALMAHEIYGSDVSAPAFHVLDSTHPEAIRRVERAIEVDRTLFIVASKSGKTVETLSLYRYFYQAAGRQPERFVAITDPGSPLATKAHEKGFKHVFENPPDIGGRYSALSYFGLVPMALMGVDIDALVASALRAKVDFDPALPLGCHPALGLGVALGAAARDGLDKVSFVASGVLDPFSAWAEQLLAESTGKDGTGLIPVPDEPLAEDGAYGNDRVFISMTVDGPGSSDAGQLERFARAGYPTIRIRLPDPIDLGGELIRWEMATAAAGAVLGVNPFDEPNVAESKEYTRQLLETKQGRRSLDGDDNLALCDGPIRLYCNQDNPHLSALPRDVPMDEFLQSFLGLTRPGDYLSLLAYVPRTRHHHQSLQVVRLMLRDRLRIATTLGYGPRYLHSTGQLHKGGANKGLFVMITADPSLTLPIPDESYGFETLVGLQALGDFRALDERQRRVVRVHLGENTDVGLDRLSRALVRGASR